MPQLSREQNKLNLSAARGAKKAKETAEEEEVKKGASSKKATQTVKKSTQEKKPKPSRIDLDDDDDLDEDDEEEDEIIQSSIKSKKEGGNNNTKFLIIGGIVVAIVVILFLIFRPKAPEVPETDVNPPVQTEQTDTSDTQQPPPEEAEIPDDPNFGTQNFLGDTNNVSDTPLTDPENFTKDIYGLTLRVDYTVSKIQEASDFVNYTKHRGTWGGGLELYYLDCEYKGNRYVIQVPFKYYKELDDEGIVPVKMEVLRIQSETDGTYLSVVSYMCLDEKTLQSVLKTQSK